MLKAIIEEKTKLPVFPRLMTHKVSPLVVLATSEMENSMTGTVLRENSVYRIGEHRKDWDKHAFSEFTGSVTITSD